METTAKAIVLATTKGIVRGTVSSLVKSVPIVGAVFGLFMGVTRLAAGDPESALLEIASGLISTIPVGGFAGSVMIDYNLALRDARRTR